MAEPCCFWGRFHMGDAVVRASADGRKGQSDTLPARNSAHDSQGGVETSFSNRCRVGDEVAPQNGARPFHLAGKQPWTPFAACAECRRGLGDNGSLVT